MQGRLVITGAGGQVGRCLAAEATRRGIPALPLTSSQWDIADADAGLRFVERGDVVVNCAALTAVDAAESDEDRAYAVNADGAGNVARTCRDAGARLIHLSTDYVFGGGVSGGGVSGGRVPGGGRRPYDIDDETGPISVYGRSKLAGEQAVHAELPAAHVVRTAWVYTGTGSDFVATMLRRAAGEGCVDVVADQVGSPTYVVDLVGALIAIAAGRISAPLLHAANEGAASRFDLARAVFAGVGADIERVRPVTTDRHPRPAPRPAYSALSGRLSAAAGLTPLRPWRDALAAALAATG